MNGSLSKNTFVILPINKQVPHSKRQFGCFNGDTEFSSPKVTSFTPNITINMNNHSMVSSFEFTSFLKEHMNYWLSLDQNGKNKNTFIKNLCKHHAADTNKCIETLETIVKFLVQFTT
uniref:SJCHGC02022 protein n=1 Tax=Schistosoma japonicum TaxID=6182 RepID=Q5DA99_SCHJA|nr:SJCHGC02022 protein [Schistosoma japonicum]